MIVSAIVRSTGLRIGKIREDVNGISGQVAEAAQGDSLSGRAGALSAGQTAAGSAGEGFSRADPESGPKYPLELSPSPGKVSPGFPD